MRTSAANRTTMSQTLKPSTITPVQAAVRYALDEHTGEDLDVLWQNIAVGDDGYDKGTLRILAEYAKKCQEALQGALVLAQCLASAKVDAEDVRRGGELTANEARQMRETFLTNNDNVLAIADRLGEWDAAFELNTN